MKERTKGKNTFIFSSSRGADFPISRSFYLLGNIKWDCWHQYYIMPVSISLRLSILFFSYFQNRTNLKSYFISISSVHHLPETIPLPHTRFFFEFCCVLLFHSVPDDVKNRPFNPNTPTWPSSVTLSILYLLPNIWQCHSRVPTGLSFLPVIHACLKLHPVHIQYFQFVLFIFSRRPNVHMINSKEMFLINICIMASPIVIEIQHSDHMFNLHFYSFNTVPVVIIRCFRKLRNSKAG